MNTTFDSEIIGKYIRSTHMFMGKEAKARDKHQHTFLAKIVYRKHKPNHNYVDVCTIVPYSAHETIKFNSHAIHAWTCLCIIL